MQSKQQSVVHKFPSIATHDEIMDLYITARDIDNYYEKKEFIKKINSIRKVEEKNHYICSDIPYTDDLSYLS